MQSEQGTLLETPITRGLTPSHPWVDGIEKHSSNGPSSIEPSSSWGAENSPAPPILPPRSFVPLVVLRTELRDKLRQYQKRTPWLPCLINRLALAYPFPFEGEVRPGS